MNKPITRSVPIGASPSDVIAGTDRHLIGAINDLIPHSDCMRSAVGYFFMSGLHGLSKDLATLDEIKLLIGNTSTRETIEQLAEGMRRLDVVDDFVESLRFSKRRERARRLRATAENVRSCLELTDQTDEAESLAALIVQLVSSGKMRVRVYPKGRLNGRAHIFDFRETSNGPGMGIVGSSNLTLAGIEDPTELNVVVHDDPAGCGVGNHGALVEWFEKLWGESLDFDAALMEEINASWAAKPASPWDVYVKTLYALVYQRLHEDRENVLFDDEITRSLAEFQRVAVQQAVSIIRRHHGCFVADVVGLGKSFIGAAIIKHFERTEGRRTLIVCPKPLEDMWHQYNERYALNAAVVPMSLLLTSDRGVDLFADYPDRDFILIDESHSFRNTNNQRYESLSTYLQADDRKVCMLTATPRNSRAMDVYNQIKLFHPEDVTDLPIDPPDLHTFFKLVEDGTRPLKDALRHVMIRRTRKHILRWWGYAEDTDRPLLSIDDKEAGPYLRGERRAYIKVGDSKNFFPQRTLTTMRYSIEDAYEGLYTNIRTKVGGGARGKGDEGRALTYARYGLWNYLRPEHRDDEQYADLRRIGTGLRGLIRVLLFKRLESSVAAFRATLHRLKDRHQMFLNAIHDGMVPAGEDAEALLGKTGILDDDEILDQLTAATQRYMLTDFEQERLIEDIENDIHVLASLIALVDPITADQDDKAQALVALLGELPAGRKALVFTQFADTASYLERIFNPHGVAQDVEAIYSQNKSKARVVGRFAPKANPAFRRRSGESEIRILIATDVLSEGLNMQDCDCVINYDLHWNPVRLIQRIGRIDRIGSEHDEIQAINFLPELGIEENLGILAILRSRIKEIHETIGEDAQILESSEQLNEDAMFAIYEEDASSLDEADDAEETLDLNEAEEFLRRLEQDDPDEFARIANLRDGIRSAKESEEHGIFALCEAGDFLQTIVADSSGKVITRDIGRSLHLIRAERDDPAPEQMPRDYNSLLHRVKSQFAEQTKERAALRSHVHRLSVGQRYVRDQLEEQIDATDDETRKDFLEMLKRVFSQSPTPAVRREMQRLRTNSVVGQPLIEALQQLYSRHRLRDRGAEGRLQDRAVIIPRIICSEALL